MVFFVFGVRELRYFNNIDIYISITLESISVGHNIYWYLLSRKK